MLGTEPWKERPSSELDDEYDPVSDSEYDPDSDP